MRRAVAAESNHRSVIVSICRPFKRQSQAEHTTERKEKKRERIVIVFTTTIVQSYTSVYESTSTLEMANETTSERRADSQRKEKIEAKESGEKSSNGQQRKGRAGDVLINDEQSRAKQSAPPNHRDDGLFVQCPTTTTTRSKGNM
jgi:hypothetical protein